MLPRALSVPTRLPCGSNLPIDKLIEFWLSVMCFAARLYSYYLPRCSQCVLLYYPVIDGASGGMRALPLADKENGVIHMRTIIIIFIAKITEGIVKEL